MKVKPLVDMLYDVRERMENPLPCDSENLDAALTLHLITLLTERLRKEQYGNERQNYNYNP